MKHILILTLCMMGFLVCGLSSRAETAFPPGAQDRRFWVESLTRIADPVLVNASRGTLRRNLPPNPAYRRDTAPLEAADRLICGISPWLELGPDDTEEGRIRAKYIDLTVKSLNNIVDPDSPDYLRFDIKTQPLVDAAFLAQGLCRAPKQLWGNLGREGQKNMIEALKKSRKINPYDNNWLLFASMVEAALLEFTGECDENRLMKGITKFRDEWYKGDGHYGDGTDFHMDYYNSFVIHPLLMETLGIMKKHGVMGADFLDVETQRFSRYAAQQERMISPEGTFPVIGRSITYRFGAFHALAQAALLGKLPAGVSPAQVRCALTAVMKRQLESPANFDDKGWLTIGFTGNQKSMAEGYISTGSPYLCAMAFLPLGLPSTDEFWVTPFEKWTSKKAWEGEPVKADKGIK